jgi:hypothetical protein
VRPLRPRRLAHRGSVIAVGFVFDPGLVGLREARRRILALWCSGVVVVEHAGLLVVTGVPPARVDVSHAPGAPLVEQHGVIAAMPLDADEARTLGRSIVLARSGVVETVDAAATPIDPAAWIDLGALEPLAVASLAPRPATAAIPIPEVIDVRALAGVDRAPAAAIAVRDALAAGESPSSDGSPSGWQRFLRWVSARVAPGPAASTSPPRRIAARSGTRSWWQRLRERIAVTMWKSRFGAVLGRRHARYLREMLDMFDRGELDRALRHAIPLGGGDGGHQLGVGVPRPRKHAELSLVPTGTRSSIPVADIATRMIRDRYRAALARLEQEGRIEDAAFVLADLLADVPGAVAFLERHGRLDLAARLAEGHHLEPGLIVRLWFLAGDRERAIDAARRLHAWADAVSRFERRSFSGWCFSSAGAGRGSDWPSGSPRWRSRVSISGATSPATCSAASALA